MFVHLYSQSACWSFPASGITVRIIVSMAVTVRQLKKTVFTYYMETEEFTTTTSSQPSKLFTRPYERWACLGVFVFMYVRCLNTPIVYFFRLCECSYSTLFLCSSKHGLGLVGLVHCSYQEKLALKCRTPYKKEEIKDIHIICINTELQADAPTAKINLL